MVDQGMFFDQVFSVVDGQSVVFEVVFSQEVLVGRILCFVLECIYFNSMFQFVVVLIVKVNGEVVFLLFQNKGVSVYIVMIVVGIIVFGSQVEFIGLFWGKNDQRGIVLSQLYGFVFEFGCIFGQL